MNSAYFDQFKIVALIVLTNSSMMMVLVVVVVISVIQGGSINPEKVAVYD